MGVEDILEELNLRMVEEHVAVAAAVPETPEEAALLSRLSSQPIHVDELCRETGMPTAQVSSTLTLMELKGMVQQVGGMNYVRLREGGATYHLSDERSDAL
jgi:DNA processing protein